ncbi:uncharacterized protein LOC118742033 [Rhagoletis pomonella]|uniref:uncharacterized protein LOC118742033 n=1 Tax=Rhagoletis pomonella TaxID=28610 RepID=UPI0017838134|nr:uncharacterized protein LOC118742033 [Rhagoletis pomonella]
MLVDLPAAQFLVKNMKANNYQLPMRQEHSQKVKAIKLQLKKNVFRVLTNSKFITIDPKYEYGNNATLSPSHQKIRLPAGGLWKTNENKSNVSREQERCLQSGQENVKLDKTAKRVQYTDSQGPVKCNNERIYRLLEHNCYEKKSTKMPTKCRIVCPREHATIEKKSERRREREVKKERKREPRGPSKDREQLRRELGNEPEEREVPAPLLVPPAAKKPPGCVDKSVDKTDELQDGGAGLDAYPSKYLVLSCSAAKKTSGEPCVEKRPCSPSMFPFPRIRQRETSVEPLPPAAPAVIEQPCHPVEEKRLPCHEREEYTPREPFTQPRPPDITKEIIAYQCNRIHNLELQVNELRRELRRMRTEIIPPDDMLRCTELTAKLRELTSLLADLKNRHAEAISEVIRGQKQASQVEKCETATEPTVVTRAPQPPRPQKKAETVQTCFTVDHTDKLSQTNATFGWRPFIDEATQSSPPSTVPVTPKNTSGVPASSHTSSASSSILPCGQDTAEIPLKESPSFCPYCQCSEYPCCTYVERNLYGEIMRLLEDHVPRDILLSVLLQPNNLYHINITVTSSGEPLGSIYATERAINGAVEADVFERFLTFFIVDARMSVQQKEKILAHTFEFFKN